MRAVELFAGAGGLGIGVSNASFEPAAVIEYDRYCCDTIRHNQRSGLATVGKWPLFEGDVRQYKFTDLSNIDFISGGPPCQPFSIGGRHRAHADARDMFPEAARAVRELMPKAFMFENVKGLTRASFTTYFEYIKLQMTYPEVAPRDDEDWTEHLKRLERHHTPGRDKGLTYRVVTRVLNAANYGVPQKRERVFFIGFRSDLGIEWSFPDATHSQDAMLWDQLHGDYWDRHEVSMRNRKLGDRPETRARKLTEQPDSLPWRTVRDAISDLPDPEKQPGKARQYANHKFQPGAKAYVGHTGSPLDEPAKTLKAGVHGVPGGENMLVRPDGSVRYFSVRESARLQTFPDEFLFHGSWSETMRQLGNAVPVSLAELLAKNIAAHLPGETTGKKH